MKLATTILTVGLIYIFSAQASAIKVTKLEWYTAQGQVTISLLAFNGSMFGSSSLTRIEPPKKGSIEAIGVEEGYSLSGFSGINSFDSIARKAGESTSFAVVQIAELSENDRRRLASEQSFYNKVLAALRKASFVTFDGNVYDVKKDFDNFTERFQQKIK